MTSNQLEDKMRLPPMLEAGASGFDQASKSGPFMEVSPQTGEGATPGVDPSAMNGSAAPQNGARRCGKHPEWMVSRPMYVLCCETLVREAAPDKRPPLRPLMKPPARERLLLIKDYPLRETPDKRSPR